MTDTGTLADNHLPVPARRLLVVTVAAAAALAVWALLAKAGGVDIAVGSGDSVQHPNAVAVVITALVVGFAAWALLALLERVTTRARRVWRGIAIAVFVVSLAGPLGGADGAAKLSLACLHLSVATVLIALLPGTPASARRR